MNAEIFSSSAAKILAFQQLSDIDSTQIRKFFRNLLPKIKRKVSAKFLKKRITQEFLPITGKVYPNIYEPNGKHKPTDGQVFSRIRRKYW
jgi:hypothetical protein